MGWGSSTRRGGGRKLRARPRKFAFLGFGRERNLGCPGIFAGMSRTPGGVHKVCAKKTSCAFFVPYFASLHLKASIFGAVPPIEVCGIFKIRALRVIAKVDSKSTEKRLPIDLLEGGVGGGGG